MSRFAVLDDETSAVPAPVPPPAPAAPKIYEPVGFFMQPSAFVVDDATFAGGTSPKPSALGAALVAAQSALLSEHASGSAPSCATTSAVHDVISSLLCAPSSNDAPTAAISPVKVAEAQSKASPSLPSTTPCASSPFGSASWSFEAMTTSTTGAQLSIEQNDAVKVMQWQTKVIARKEKARAEMNLSKRMKDRKARLSAKAEDAGDRLSAKAARTSAKQKLRQKLRNMY